MNVRELLEALEAILNDDPNAEELTVFLDPQYSRLYRLRSVDVDYVEGTVTGIALA